MAWVTPKTDWVSTDRFNYDDYNRIKNNLQWLCEKAMKLWKPFEAKDMGDDITSYRDYWDFERFNQFEQNLDAINQNIFTKDYGNAQVFYENGPFIKWDELNRIESACLSMHGILTSQEKGLTKLAFRLGAPKFAFGGTRIKFPVMVTKKLSFTLGGQQLPAGGENIKIPVTLTKRLPFKLRK